MPPFGDDTDCPLPGPQQLLCLGILRDVKKETGTNREHIAEISTKIEVLSRDVSALVDGTATSPPLRDRLNKIESLLDKHISEYEETKLAALDSKRAKRTATISLLIAIVAAMLRFLPQAVVNWIEGKL